LGAWRNGLLSLIDPIRNIETYDYQNNDLAAQPPPVFPTDPIRNPTNDFGNGNPAAVSAHYHATVVFDFYNNVLTRKGVDNKGMKLVSVINVYQSDRNPLPAPQWGNAVWWNGKMWYGQKNGVSYARYLDVIAHELTHGVTQSSSNLIYRRVSGALNESYSDIFGVVIANWYPAAPQPLGGWTWEIGAGLGRGGGPIRHFGDPQRAGHIYSGIHNKAIYKLLTDTDDQGTLTFPTQEAVMLLYWTLIRLTPTSDFADSRRTLESVTRTYYASDPATMNVRLNAIAAAFQAVGL
jgi:bacillolysin